MPTGAHDTLVTSIRAIRDLVNVEASHLDVLRRVERMMDELVHAERALSTIAYLLEGLVNRLRQGFDGEVEWDPDGALVTTLLEAEQSSASLAQQYTEMKGMVRADRNVGEDYASTIVTCLDRAAEVAKRCAQGFHDVRWTILEHDADREDDTDEVIESAEDLIRMLRA